MAAGANGALSEKQKLAFGFGLLKERFVDSVLTPPYTSQFVVACLPQSL